MVKVSFPFTDYCQVDSQREGIPLNNAPACETSQMKLKRTAVVSTSKH
jgi:hypothetical protein